MANHDELAKVAEGLGTGPAAKELYSDLLRPSAQELGKNVFAVSKLITAVFAPLHALVWGIDVIRDWLIGALEERLASVPEEKIQQPEPHIAGQILLQLPFCAEESTLRGLYANLLAAAMNKDRASGVHPSFVHVIQQLTPDEALVLNFIHCGDKPFTMWEEFRERAIDRVEKTVSDQFRTICERAGVADCSMSDAYLDNLLRLRVLIELHWSDGEYNPPSFSRYGTYEPSIENKSGRQIEIGPFGERFMGVCMPLEPRAAL